MLTGKPAEYFADDVPGRGRSDATPKEQTKANLSGKRDL